MTGDRQPTISHMAKRVGISRKRENVFHKKHMVFVNILQLKMSNLLGTLLRSRNQTTVDAVEA